MKCLPPREVSVGDHVRFDGDTYTIAVSEPCDMNPGGWHLETEETDPNNPAGWPYSVRYIGSNHAVEVL